MDDVQFIFHSLCRLHMLKTNYQQILKILFKSSQQKMLNSLKFYSTT